MPAANSPDGQDPNEEAAAELVGNVGRRLQQIFTEVRPTEIKSDDRRLSGFANLRLSDLADLGIALGCRVEISFIPD